jgi:hypothetical protein
VPHGAPDQGDIRSELSGRGALAERDGDVLADIPGYYTPSMRKLIDLDTIWRRARKLAQAAPEDQGKTIGDVPSACPPTLDDFLSDAFSPDAVLAKISRRS